MTQFSISKKDMLKKEGHENWKLNINPRGFSLVELMIVVAVMTILLSIAIGAFTGFQFKVRLETNTSEVVTLLRDAQNRSLTNVDGDGDGAGDYWGLKIDVGTGEYTLVYCRTIASGGSPTARCNNATNDLPTAVTKRFVDGVSLTAVTCSPSCALAGGAATEHLVVFNRSSGATLTSLNESLDAQIQLTGSGAGDRFIRACPAGSIAFAPSLPSC